IGSRNNGDYTFDGFLDDVRIYNRALTSSEIQQLANLTSTGTPHPGDADGNMHMTLNEATNYGFCWKSAPTIPTGCPTPAATLDNSVRAGTLWNTTSSGLYHYDSSKPCPLCWVAGP